MKFSLAVVVGMLILALVLACGQSSIPGALTLGSTSVELASPTAETHDSIPTLADTQHIPPTATNPLVSFPTQAPTDAYATALLRGQLVVNNSCLWIMSNTGDNYPIIWPHGYSWSIADGVIQVLDATGGIVARVGDEIALGGGEGPGTQPGAGCMTAPMAWYATYRVDTADDASPAASPPAHP